MRHSGLRATAAIAALLIGFAGIRALAAGDEAESLLALHAKVMRAHLDGDVEALLADESDDYVVADRGEILRPTLAERRTLFEPYFAETRFHEYRDVTEPVVDISGDGTMGWVIVSVRARGVRTRPDGTRQPVDFTSAWIELYEKRDGRWLRTGNVSNFKD